MHNNCPAKGKKREKINSSKYKPTLSVNKIGSHTRVHTCAHMHRGQLTIYKQLGSTDTNLDMDTGMIRQHDNFQKIRTQHGGNTHIN